MGAKEKGAPQEPGNKQAPPWGWGTLRRGARMGPASRVRTQGGKGIKKSVSEREHGVQTDLALFQLLQLISCVT